MPEVAPGRFMVQAGWDSVPHLAAETKAEMLAAYPPHERDARTKGIPALGSGAIYPLAEEELLVDPFEIPAYWPRGYGLDVGWNRTAAVWGAHDRTTDTVYLYTEHYRGQAEPAVHAAAIKARGDWIPGFIDPASRASSQIDGQQLIVRYRQAGLSVTTAPNGVEAGIFAVWDRLSTGRLKVFRHLSSWRSEYRLYRRDEKGRVVKQHDHIMDATRYLIMMINSMTTQPRPPQGLPVGVGDAVMGY